MSPVLEALVMGVADLGWSVGASLLLMQKIF
jgi:hypothetical protein